MGVEIHGSADMEHTVTVAFWFMSKTILISPYYYWEKIKSSKHYFFLYWRN